MNVGKIIKRKFRNGCIVLRREGSYLLDFGFRLWFYKTLAESSYRKNREKGLAYYEKKHKLAKKYIVKHYGDILSESNEGKKLKNIAENCSIWILWWQGVEEAPDIIKVCIDSIKRHSGKHNVQIITKENYQDFIDIEDSVFQQLSREKVSLNHLSDLIRCKLLYKYGGIWCDASLFLSKELDRKIYEYPFYTIKHGIIVNCETEPSQCRWRAFFMASSEGNVMFKVCYEIMERWLGSGKQVIDYFLIDYNFWLVYDRNPCVRNMIDSIPENNKNVYRLSSMLNKPYDEKQICDVYESGGVFKFSQKLYLSKEENTYYDHLVKEYYSHE